MQAWHGHDSWAAGAGVSGTWAANTWELWLCCGHWLLFIWAWLVDEWLHWSWTDWDGVELFELSVRDQSVLTNILNTWCWMRCCRSFWIIMLWCGVDSDESIFDSSDSDSESSSSSDRSTNSNLSSKTIEEDKEYWYKEVESK